MLKTQNPITGCLPGIKEAGPEDHYRLTSALLQLGLDRAELTVNDGHHALNLSRSHGPCARLLPQQVHDMGGEFSACLGKGGITRRTVKDRKVQSSAGSFIISCWFDVHYQQANTDSTSMKLLVLINSNWQHYITLLISKHVQLLQIGL